jgi:hypothetical protein
MGCTLLAVQVFDGKLSVFAPTEQFFFGGGVDFGSIWPRF